MDEVRYFSKVASENPHFKNALLQGSVSQKDAMNRMVAYEKVFSNYAELREIVQRAFSGAGEIPILSNQYINATAISYATSFAGHLCIERALDQPTALAYFTDLLGVADNRIVMPNIGLEDLSNIAQRISWSTIMTNGTALYEVALGKKIIPGSVKVTLKHVATGATYELIDDRNGNLLGASGLLAPNADASPNINYSTGNIGLTIGTSFTIALNDLLTLYAAEDTPGTPETGSSIVPADRFKLDLKHVPVSTIPRLLIGESNLVTLAVAEKALKQNISDIVAAKLIELYTKIVNTELVTLINSGYVGSTSSLDIKQATNQYSTYESTLRLFNSQLVDVNSTLAKKSTKGVRASSYLVGLKTADWFLKLASVGLFTENEGRSYINDVIGYYKGTIPVMLHSDLGDYDGFAIHKTPDGNIAPLLRGIFLPLTNTPAVMNYNNPTQVSQGVFYQEGADQIASALVQKFTIVDH